MVRFILIPFLLLYPTLSLAQQVRNVPEAFKSLNPEPQVIVIANDIEVPIEGGHLQGVQAIQRDGNQMLLMSGSSQTQAYLLQVNLSTAKADRMITLMQEPYRHAGGLQVSKDFLAVGIEDNHTRTTSKVCLYHYRNGSLQEARPAMVVERNGEKERFTAGATGLLATDQGYLMVVGNWNSRYWDFYRVDPENNEARPIGSYAVPDDWPAYQSINLIEDNEAIYAIGFYGKGPSGGADLIKVSASGEFELIMEKVAEKTFNCKDGVDFATATGLQVDEEGQLHVWGTQRDALNQIVVNKFSQQ